MLGLQAHRCMCYIGLLLLVAIKNVTERPRNKLSLLPWNQNYVDVIQHENIVVFSHRINLQRLLNATWLVFYPQVYFTVQDNVLYDARLRTANQTAVVRLSLLSSIAELSPP